MIGCNLMFISIDTLLLISFKSNLIHFNNMID